MNKVVGIVSYLPDDEMKRSVRERRLRSLIDSVKKLFPNVPIIAIAQNWKGLKFDGVSTFEHDAPLGILQARRELRRVFLDSDYEYLIMLDDDVSLKGKSSKRYLDAIDSNPGMFYEKSGSALKLFCIHKDVFDEYPEVDPQKGQGYEDRAFVSMLRENRPESRYVFGEVGLDVIDNATNDEFSTWVRPCGPAEMRKRTETTLANIRLKHAKLSELRNDGSFSHVVECTE